MTDEKLKSLETCSEALKKGLITQADYDTAKATFLRCEQLALGFQVGLVQQSDLLAAKVSRERVTTGKGRNG